MYENPRGTTALRPAADAHVLFTYTGTISKIWNLAWVTKNQIYVTVVKYEILQQLQKSIIQKYEI